MTTNLSRRTFLQRTAMLSLAATAGPVILAACGSSKSSSKSSTTTAGGGAGSTPAKDLGTMSMQLSWVKNAEFAGNYIADTNGYYTQNGFSKVDLLSGGPGVAVEPVVNDGKALLGYTFSEAFAAAVAQGAKLKVLGSLYQRNPFCIMSLEAKPIRTPQDLKGKKIGVQDVNKPIWDALLQVNNIDPKDVTVIPAQFDPTPVTKGEVDGWFSFLINEPIDLQLKGFKPVTMALADYGFNVNQELFITSEDNLKNKPDELVAALKATLKGWQENAKDPTVAARLVIDKYGKDVGSTYEKELGENKAQILLIENDLTKTKGIGYMDDATIQRNIDLLAKMNLTLTKDTYTMEILDKVYANGVTL